MSMMNNIQLKDGPGSALQGGNQLDSSMKIPS